jgi:hypothetical protein
MRIPRHTTVAAYGALFLTLGGVSYAAASLPAGSVGNRELRKDAVTSAKVRNGGLSASDLSSGALAAGARGEPGRRGSGGPQGAQGAPGAKGEPGTVDTSSLYDKPQADARFLQGAGSRVAVARATVPANSDALLLAIPPLGQLSAFCEAPDPRAAVEWRNPPDGIASEEITLAMAGSAADAMSNHWTMGPDDGILSTPFAGIEAVRQVTYTVTGGSTSVTIHVSLVTSPRGADTCKFAATALVQDATP